MSEQNKPKYPGIREAMDGNTAVIMCERESSDAAGAYPITPSTQMGEYWAEATAAGHVNVSDRSLIFIEPEGEHAAAAVTAGLSMTGLRSCNFSSGQGIAYMHESLYAAVGKRLTYVLNMGCRAMTKSTLNVHAGHDDYHAVDDTGFFQVMGKNAQEVCDLNIMAHKIAELSLNPGIVGQDGFLTTHLIESLLLPERELIAEYLGRPEDLIDSPTPAQRLMYGDKRRRIPELWSVDNPVLAGAVQNQDAYMQSVAAQRPYFFDHIAGLADQCMADFSALTGREYKRVLTYNLEDAEYVLIGQGSVVPSLEVVSDYLRETRGVKVGVINIVMWRPFPSDLLTPLLKGRKGVAVLERIDQPLAEDLPVVREVRAAVSKAQENARANGAKPFPHHDTYASPDDVPNIYSASFGMGSRDLQPEGVIAAVENMLPDGKHKRMFYLSIDFVHPEPYTPKQQVYQDQILEGYPHVKDLALRGSENPNLMPDGAITVRFHSIGGWGAITTGKNLAMTLFDLLGYHIKANPKYGSEKKGQPTTYYLSAAPEPIRVNCEYFYVDVVLSPDPNVFSHSNPLAGLKEGGVFIIQSEYETAEEVWQYQIPKRYQDVIAENNIRVLFVDGFKIAREIATDPDLQFRMQGIAFMGAFFKGSDVMNQAELEESKLFDAIETQLEHKFGAKGRRIVEDNMRVVRRGYDEVKVVSETPKPVAQEETARKAPDLPLMLRQQPSSQDAATDIHRFWEQTGNFYATGKGTENLADPFIGMSLIPAATGVFRDMTAIRNAHPVWIPERCTGCSQCWTVCPDMAIPGLVHSISEILDTAIKRMERAGKSTKHLRKSSRTVERRLAELLNEGNNSDSVNDFVRQAIEDAIEASTLPDDQREEMESELRELYAEMKDFQFARTQPFWALREKESKGSGGLLSITVDPWTCKGCMECVQVCPVDALTDVLQTTDSIQKLRRNWEFWLDLPNTNKEFMRIENLEEGEGALETLLLDKDAYKAVVGGDGACLGCGEKTAIHLFTATVQALMQPRVKKQVQKLEDLISGLERHIRLKLVESVNVSDTTAVEQAMDSLRDKELTLANLSAELDKQNVSAPLDSDWMHFVTRLLAKLRHLHWQYTEGVTGRGRVSMGILNATGCTSVWGSTFPYNPYPFPWANHLFQDTASMAMGVFEGHMAKMADGFKAVRMAEMELDGGYKEQEHGEFFQYFDWNDFTDEEFHLCPPVVAVGGDGALYDIGFQNVSRALISGKPIKIICMDTQVYSNTGGQACTSGFYGQVSDMAQYGKAHKGKEEVRKEIGLIGMAHRTAYILQGTFANPGHLIKGFIEGLQSRRPAFLNVFTPCMPEHGIGDELGKHQSRLALESRAYPAYSYDPDKGDTVKEGLDIEGNPAIEDDWPSYNLSYVDEDGNEQTMDMPLTFADYAATEARFRKHFRRAPRDSWNEDMMPIAEYLELPEDDREGRIPFVWAVDKRGQLTRLVASHEMVIASEDRRQFWRMLKGLAGLDEQIDPDQIAQDAKREALQQLTAGLAQLAGIDANGGGAAEGAPAVVQAQTQASESDAPAAAKQVPVEPAAQQMKPSEDAALPWVDTENCISCGECLQVNSKMFAYNDESKAIITDPKAGTYKDLVKAAEKCPAQVIHPGDPLDPNEKGVERLKKRAAKFNQ